MKKIIIPVVTLLLTSCNSSDKRAENVIADTQPMDTAIAEPAYAVQFAQYSSVVGTRK